MSPIFNGYDYYSPLVAIFCKLYARNQPNDTDYTIDENIQLFLRLHFNILKEYLTKRISNMSTSARFKIKVPKSHERLGSNGFIILLNTISFFSDTAQFLWLSMITRQV